MSTRQDKEEQLVEAAKSGNLRRITELLLEKVNVNYAAGWLGRTPLHNAVLNGHTGIIKTLLKAGAKVDVTMYGQTPLHCAKSADNVKALVEAGADPNAVDVDGMTATHFAAFHGRTDTTKALMEAGAQTDIGDKWGRTPLFMAARNGNTKSVKALLDAGAKIDMVDQKGYTAETQATHDGHHEIAELLKRARLQGCKKKEKKPAVNIEEEFVCPICMEVAENAVETSCCHHIYCEECIADVDNNTCPQCRLPFTTTVSHVVRRMIGNLPADCPYNCDAKITKSELKAHTENCPQKLYTCPAPKCDFNGDRKAFVKHLPTAHEDDLIRNASKLF